MYCLVSFEQLGFKQYRQIAEENSGFYNTMNAIFREQNYFLNLVLFQQLSVSLKLIFEELDN